MPLDPQARQILDQLEKLGIPDFCELSPEQARAVFDQMQAPVPPLPVGSVEDRTLPGPAGEIPVRVYQPDAGRRKRRARRPGLVFFHGGGWVIGGIDSHDQTCRELCSRVGACVVAVDYRLAPETRFPGAAEDCFSATRWVAQNAEALGVDPTRLAVAGDSAGGNLAAAVCLMARHRHGPALRFQLLVYPVTDADFERASYRENAEGYLLSRASMQWFWNHYVPDAADRASPYAAPLRSASHADLPPALVITAEFDPLRDEGEAYAEALTNAGVPATCTRYHGMIHGFFGFASVVDQAKRALDEASAALREALHA
jgi:acetyl esterase